MAPASDGTKSLARARTSRRCASRWISNRSRSRSRRVRIKNREISSGARVRMERSSSPGVTSLELHREVALHRNLQLLGVGVTERRRRLELLHGLLQLALQAFADLVVAQDL